MVDQTKGLLSPFLRWRRLKVVLPYIRGKVLDFGCGVGLLVRYLSSEECYIGVDIDQKSIDTAKNLNPQRVFFVVDRENFFWKVNKYGPFNTIVMLAVLEYLEEPEKVLLKLRKLLSNSGYAYIVLTTPHPISNNIHNFGSKIGFFSKKANEQHRKLYDYKTMGKVCFNTGMKIIKYRRFLMGFNQLFLIRPLSNEIYF